MEPLVSLIMPCYNSAPYLDAALASVQAQTLHAYELLAVDDGSTDATRARLMAAARDDTRIRVFTQSNRGVSAARNRALDAARGRYVCFADPDDTLAPDMLEKAVARLDATQADCCLFAYRRRFGDAGAWHTMPLQDVYEYRSTEEIIAGFFPHLFGYSDEQARIWGRRGDWRAGREEGAVCRGAYRLDVIRRGHVRFDETIALYEDAMFNCDYLLTAQSMTCLNDALYNYTVRPSGAVTRLNRAPVRLLANKLRLLAKREALDARTGGRLWPLYSASCVFSALEMIRALAFQPTLWREGLPYMRAYLAAPALRRALETFPLPARRPLAALLIQALRCYCRAAASAR